MGDPARVDMTHSVTKTFLTTTVGLAFQRGLIKDVNDYVRDYMPPDIDLFASEHNRKIKWDHLLRQTSDWQGTLWGKPDWADRPVGANAAEWATRKLWEPGTHFKYNDVRVNVLALAALQVWRKPLPDVLREEVMEPIGASSTWRWQWVLTPAVEIDGKKVQSVSGGGHWGGGMFINAYDMARFGYLFLHNGKWKDRQIVSPKWIEMARTPGSDNATYGYANWSLNTGRKPLPAAPETAVRFTGNGANIIYVDWENDVVAVFRWIAGDGTNKSVEKIIASLKVPAKTTTGISRPPIAHWRRGEPGSHRDPGSRGCPGSIRPERSCDQEPARKLLSTSSVCCLPSRRTLWPAPVMWTILPFFSLRVTSSFCFRSSPCASALRISVGAVIVVKSSLMGGRAPGVIRAVAGW